MLKVQIGKGLEMEVDISRFNDEVRDHVIRTGLRNLLMDAHASATAKADPKGYVIKSRALAEKKLASLYAGIVRGQTIGGLKRRPIRSVKSSCAWPGKRSPRDRKSLQHRKRTD
jgi:hypothetical protein